MSAYRVVLTPAGTGAVTTPHVPWTASYEAESATITSGQVRTQGTVDDANGYAVSGTKDVGSLNRPDSKVDFTVDVPRDGTYDLAVLYGNQSGAPATQRLLVDGRIQATVSYPSTENWTYRGLRETQVRLTAGRHTLTLAKAEAEVTLDRIDLTRHTTPAAYYDAALADISGDPAFRYHGGSGELHLARGDSAVFDVYAPRDGYYTVTARGASAVRLSLHGEMLTARPGERLRLHLAEGNNRITATGPAILRGLDISGRGSTTGVLVKEAAEARLAGGARLVDSRYASGGSYVGMLGNSPASKATFDVDVPRAGRYQLIVRYANNDRRDNGHAYNTDIMSRTADITAGSTTRRVTFKNTWSWNDCWTLAVPVHSE
ncbi:hypothetical protein GCM10010446_06610 [Streptomyces enissocaesilis]|uniref:CBM6 domain-containing protein n=2 Tax=Streptomyces enissocaesilis TaxID=332589 RepID=A0ABN3WSZ6_9ACTN